MASLEKYDSELKEKGIIYGMYPELLPFIGRDYEKYKILHVGESHFLGQPDLDEKQFAEIDRMESWFECRDCELLEKFGNSVCTRHVVEDKYLNDVNDASYRIFDNVLKSFSRVVLGEEILHMTAEKRDGYNYFAFMNFFQMPSLYSGVSFWTALEKSAKKTAEGKKEAKELARKVWYMTAEQSCRALDQAIEILDPDAVVFTSRSAGKIYSGDPKYNDVTRFRAGEHCNEDRIIYTSHPGDPRSWERQLKSLGGKKGVDVFEEGLRKIYLQGKQ